MLMLALMLAMFSALATGAQSPSGNSTTEKKLQDAREQLSRSKAEARDVEKGLSQAERQLQAADGRVNAAGRALAELESQLQTQQLALEQMRSQRVSLESGISEQRASLTKLIRMADAQGNQTALRLMLSGAASGDEQRLLVYNRYLQQERITALNRFNADLKELDALETQIAEQQSALIARQQEAQAAQQRLINARRKQAMDVQELQREQAEHRNRQETLTRDVRTLEGVLANLRAQAARAEAQKRQAEARAAQQRQQASRQSQTQSQGKKTSSDAAVSRRQTTPGGQVDTRTAASNTGQRVGGGSWPVSGALVTRFGARLPDGRNSTGLLIAASSGSNVTAVADGTVVYADWMTGYGNILIIDHGSGDMTLYAHNESLLRSQGQRVKRGDVVARVGSSGGQERTALYFELRRNGQPVDPSGWLRR